jgi:hypothetical protein
MSPRRPIRETIQQKNPDANVRVFAINRKNKSTPTPVTQTSLLNGSPTAKMAFAERNRTNVTIAVIE